MPRLPLTTLSVLATVSLALVFSTDDPVGDARHRVERQRGPLAGAAALPVIRESALRVVWAIDRHVDLAVQPTASGPQHLPRTALLLEFPDAEADIRTETASR